MEAQTKRPVSHSATEQVQYVLPKHLNGVGMLFGGQLAMWIDEVAGVVAVRHCGTHITTAAIDNLRFRHAVKQGQLVVLRGKVTYVGKTSLEVRVDSFVEGMDGDRRLINTAFVIQVALDENGRPTEAPGLLCETEFEEQEFLAGARRKELRHKLAKDIYE